MLNEESPRNRRLDIDTSGAGKWELLQSQITKNFFLLSFVNKGTVPIWLVDFKLLIYSDLPVELLELRDHQPIYSIPNLTFYHDDRRSKITKTLQWKHHHRYKNLISTGSSHRHLTKKRTDHIAIFTELFHRYSVMKLAQDLKNRK